MDPGGSTTLLLQHLGTAKPQAINAAMANGGATGMSSPIKPTRNRGGSDGGGAFRAVWLIRTMLRPTLTNASAISERNFIILFFFCVHVFVCCNYADED